jgi:DUF1365 family protein
MAPSSALFLGSVIHRRLKPRRHRLRYRAYWLFLDLEDIDRLDGTLRLFSRNRFNVFAFYDRDHCEAGRGDLRGEIIDAVRDAGIAPDPERICVLTMPRVLGYVFNPLSTYFCYAAAGRLAAVVYEVHNTFGGRHRYALAVGTQDGPVVQRCRKRFYVSPFMDMELDYKFRVRRPGERVSVAISASDAAGPVLVAALSGERSELTDARLLRLFLSIPALTLKVIVGIHWEALRLWLKGVRIRPRSSAIAKSPQTGR